MKANTLDHLAIKGLFIICTVLFPFALQYKNVAPNFGPTDQILAEIAVTNMTQPGTRTLTTSTSQYMNHSNHYANTASQYFNNTQDFHQDEPVDQKPDIK